MNFVNLPKKLDRKFYQACQDNFVKLAGSNSDIVSAYKSGSVSDPGISDLDFILCLKDNLKEELSIEERLDPKLKYIIGGGTILKINKSNFRDLKIIDDFNLEHLYGLKFKFTDFDDKVFEICRFMDWVPERLFSLLKEKKSQETDVIRSLQIMKSINFNLGKLSKLTKLTGRTTFINKVKNLRANWFENKNRLEDFEKLLTESIEISQRMLNQLDDYLIKKKYIFGNFDDNYEDISFDIKGGPRFLFGEKATVNSGGEVVLPKTFFYFLSAQTVLSKGFISDNLKKSFNKTLTNLNINVCINKELTQTIRERINYCEKVAQFLKKNNIKIGLLKYGWFLQNYE